MPPTSNHGFCTFLFFNQCGNISSKKLGVSVHFLAKRNLNTTTPHLRCGAQQVFLPAQENARKCTLTPSLLELWWGAQVAGRGGDDLLEMGP
jgi:hypothetical protein